MKKSTLMRNLSAALKPQRDAVTAAYYWPPHRRFCERYPYLRPLCRG